MFRRDASVAMKFILPTALAIILILGAGAALTIKQQRDAALREVREQTKLIESQIGVVRAYIGQEDGRQRKPPKTCHL